VYIKTNELWVAGGGLMRPK